MKLPGIYRVHDKPNKEKLEVFLKFLNRKGYNIKADINKFKNTDYQKLLKMFQGKPDEIISNAHMQNGIDLSNTILLRYADNVFASVDSGFEIPLRNNAVISGTDGIILFGEGFHCTEEVKLYDKAGTVRRRNHRTARILGKSHVRTNRTGTGKGTEKGNVQ